MTDEYEWTHETPRIRSNGERIERGDVFVPTTHEKRVWPDRIEPQATCAGTTSDGRPCMRAVDDEGDRCYQHEIINPDVEE